MKSRTKKIISIIIVTIILILSAILFTYFKFFAPKEEVTPITTQITINNRDIVKKFLPKNFSLSLKELNLESNTVFSENELTDLFIVAINEIPDLKNMVSGLRVKIDDNLINIYAQFKYYNIPLEAKFTFSCEAKNGKGIFHYEKGNIGFINISKKAIFSNTKDTSVIQFDKHNGNIILAFPTIRQLNVQDLKCVNNSLDIVFKGTIQFWDWLKD